MRKQRVAARVTESPESAQSDESGIRLSWYTWKIGLRPHFQLVLSHRRNAWSTSFVTIEAAFATLRSDGTTLKWLLTSCCCSPMVWKNNLPIFRGNFRLHDFKRTSLFELPSTPN